MADKANAALYIFLFKIYSPLQDALGPLECLFGSISQIYSDFYLMSGLTSCRPKQTSVKEQIHSSAKVFSYL